MCARLLNIIPAVTAVVWVYLQVIIRRRVVSGGEEVLFCPLNQLSGRRVCRTCFTKTVSRDEISIAVCHELVARVTDVACAF